ncbi:MAG: single-stranded DNA-binding protein [Nitrosopumilus sp. B06]|nr:MAG: single-stranded DNA-binding protein [Nitrosopumilus sp. B06]
MSELESLVNELMERKPELVREDIDEQIRIKKEKIGAGYLTDQGAVFLIAADHGVTLGDPLKTEMGLKNLYAGAREISLETRVMSLSPAKQFSRKDGSPFFLRTMTVYDEDSAVSVKLWDEKANLESVKNLKPGDLIKIIKAYVKSDFDGSPTINIGSGSDIEIADTESKIPPIDTMIKDIGEVKEGDKNIAVSGITDGTISTMSFTNSRGNPGTALRMRLKGSNGNVTRVVLWGKDDSEIPNVISKSAMVKLFGVRAKQGNQGLEVHGSDATQINIDGSSEAEPLIVRVLTITATDTGKRMILAVNKSGELYNIVDSANMTATCEEGNMVECMPSKVYGNSVTLDEKSLVRNIGNDESVPLLPQVTTKVDNVKADMHCCIDAIVLKKADKREIQTKSGEAVSLSEMLVGDDTGQIWVKGWRNHAMHIDECSLGDMIAVTGLNARPGMEGRIELVLTAFSKITKKSSPKTLE